MKWLNQRRVDSPKYKDYQMFDFSELDLSYKDFSKASITRSKFNDHNLYGANFSGASFDLSSFHNSNMGEANFRKSSLSCCDFWACDLEAADFQGAFLDHCTFINCNFSMASMAYLKTFTECQFINSNVWDAITWGTNFWSSDLGGNNSWYSFGPTGEFYASTKGKEYLSGHIFFVDDEFIFKYAGYTYKGIDHLRSGLETIFSEDFGSIFCLGSFSTPAEFKDHLLTQFILGVKSLVQRSAKSGYGFDLNSLDLYGDSGSETLQLMERIDALEAEKATYLQTIHDLYGYGNFFEPGTAEEVVEITRCRICSTDTRVGCEPACSRELAETLNYKGVPTK